jgi:lactate permease
MEVWPATLVAGGVFAVVQWIVSSLAATYLLTDVLAGLCSVIAVVLFLRVWQPRTRFLLRRERLEVAGGLGAVGPGAMAAHPEATATANQYRYPYTPGQTLEAWVPWVILIACVGIWGLNTASFNDALPVPGRTSATSAVVLGTPLGVPVEATSFTRLLFDMPGADKQIQRTTPVVNPCQSGQTSTPQAPCVGPERVQFTLNWLSAPGTATVLAAILSGLFVRLTAAQWREVIARTARRLRVPILVIGQVLGLAALTRFAGTDAILGLAFTVTGGFYPFFAAYLGWLGVFLTGSDTASNALFGSLQRITAEQLHLSPILSAATNSTGGVMGKMIDAQSITVATAACYEDPTEGSLALGPIFRRVFWFSVMGAAFIGLIALVQAYVFPGVIPPMPQ